MHYLSGSSNVDTVWCVVIELFHDIKGKWIEKEKESGACA